MRVHRIEPAKKIVVQASSLFLEKMVQELLYIVADTTEWVCIWNDFGIKW